MTNALTIDLEEWYHISGIERYLKIAEFDKYAPRVAENTVRLLDILSEAKVKATFFVLGSVAIKFPWLIRRIDDEGHEIATHSLNHKVVYNQTQDEFSNDLEEAIMFLSDIIGKKILGFRAPDFSITKKSLWAINILINHGIKYDCSIFPIRHPRYGIPNAPHFPYKIKDDLIEFPPSTIKILNYSFPIGGGAYFRVLPYNIIKKAIKYLNIKGKPANMYLHPWEIDPKQPRIKMPIVRYFMHYTNLSTTEKKLKCLLRDFKFAPVKEVLGIV
jgi:polysaccharide deacetylase family protein (PEP-CTERM system associated)